MYCISFSQEMQQECPLKVHLPNSMQGGRRVDVVSTPVKEDRAILPLKDSPRGQCIGTSQEVACTLI
jgi:hypothetical protein